MTAGPTARVRPKGHAGQRPGRNWAPPWIFPDGSGFPGVPRGRQTRHQLLGSGVPGALRLRGRAHLREIRCPTFPPTPSRSARNGSAATGRRVLGGHVMQPGPARTPQRHHVARPAGPCDHVILGGAVFALKRHHFARPRGRLSETSAVTAPEPPGRGGGGGGGAWVSPEPPAGRAPPSRPHRRAQVSRWAGGARSSPSLPPSLRPGGPCPRVVSPRGRGGGGSQPLVGGLHLRRQLSGASPLFSHLDRGGSGI